MGCCGKHSVVKKDTEKRVRNLLRSSDFFLGPFEPCVFCAEKHLSDAFDLARECGYEVPNRQTIIGALGSAARHLWAEHRDTAERIRALRHIIQMRKEASADWMPLLREMDTLVGQEIANGEKI